MHVVIQMCSILVLARGIFIQDTLSSNQHGKREPHIKKSLPHYRQSPQKCVLICPGGPPLDLPPNFAQNCSSGAHSTQKPQNNGSTTSRKPSTTTDSAEGSNETDESTEEIMEVSTKGSGQVKKQGNMRRRQNTNKNYPSPSKRKTQSKKHKQHQNKYRPLKKEKVLLAYKVRKELFKHYKDIQGRRNLDGCHVVCSDGTESSYPDNGGNQGYIPEGTVTDGSGSDEAEIDPYIPGEDTAIEIIYIPNSAKSNHIPIDLYQPNNYAFIEPQPAFGYGYDSFNVEGKQKITKKKKLKSWKKEEKFKRNSASKGKTKKSY